MRRIGTSCFGSGRSKTAKVSARRRLQRKTRQGAIARKCPPQLQQRFHPPSYGGIVCRRTDQTLLQLKAFWRGWWRIHVWEMKSA